MIELVPVKQFSMRLRQGWTMVPGYPLMPGDYAVTMLAPAGTQPASNLGRAASIRNVLAAAKRRAAEERA